MPSAPSSGSSGRAMRIQGQAAETPPEEVIRFEADKKVGGGDLMVPVSMVDYENLGEGSIVDQVRPGRIVSNVLSAA